MLHRVAILLRPDDPVLVELSFDGEVFAEYEAETDPAASLKIFARRSGEPWCFSVEDFRTGWDDFIGQLNKEP